MPQGAGLTRTAVAWLALGVGFAVLFSAGAFAARTGVPVETRALLLGFAACYALELWRLPPWVGTRRLAGRRSLAIAIAGIVFCLVSIFIMVVVVVPSTPHTATTHARILFLGVANFALAVALRVANRTDLARLTMRAKQLETEDRLAFLANAAPTRHPSEPTNRPRQNS